MNYMAKGSGLMERVVQSAESYCQNRDVSF